MRRARVTRKIDGKNTFMKTQKTQFDYNGFFENLLEILIVTLLIILFLGVYKNIIYPAWLSTTSVCFPSHQNISLTGYVVGGSYNSENNTISVFYENSNKETLKHETCHRVQFSENRLFNCRVGGLLLMTNEIECYAAQKLSDRLFIRIYGEF